MPGNFICILVDLSIFFSSKRESRGKGFVWDSGAITAQSRHELQYHQIPEKLPWICITYVCLIFGLKAVVSHDSSSQAKAWADKNETMTIYRQGSVYKQVTGTRKWEESTKAFPKLIDINCITPFLFS